MTEDIREYNDTPGNEKLTRKRLRSLICELYILEGNWKKITENDRAELWYILKNPTFERILYKNNIYSKEL